MNVCVNKNFQRQNRACNKKKILLKYESFKNNDNYTTGIYYFCKFDKCSFQ